MKFDIAIPVLNEEQTLKIQIEKILTYISQQTFSHHNIGIIISDNGSTDNTSIIANKLTTSYPDKVTYIKVNEKGVGLSLKVAWKQSNADIVGYMYLDLATDINHLKTVVKIFENKSCDILYGSRLCKGSKVINRSLKREITSRIFNIILQQYLNVKISDGMCGFKFLRKDIVDELLVNGANSNGWFFCAEILVVADWGHKTLKELPIIWTDDTNSKVNIKKLTFEYISAMRRLKNTFYKKGLY